MTPLGWGPALFVWVYALAWFLLNDQMKLLAYRILDPAKAELEPTAEPKPEPTAEPKPAAAAEPRRKPAAAAEPRPDQPPDLTPQLVKRVHEMYEELGREEVQAVENWERADRQVPKGEPDE